MANFTNIQITNLGRALQAKAQAGAPLVFTRFRVGSGSMSGQQIADMTNLITPVMWLTLNKSQPTSAGRYTVGAPFTNSGISTGFYFREWGVFATDPELGEILYCYGNVGAGAEYIPAGGGSEIVEQQLDMITLIGNAANVSAVIDESLVFATIQQINEHKSAAVIDHPDGSVTAEKLASGAVTDAKIGNRTINLDITAAYAMSGSITSLFSWIGKYIRSLVGGTNLFDPPAITLAQTKTHVDDATRHITASERTNWNAKAGTAVATSSTAGLMSATDKSKLDGVAAGAQVNTVTSVAGKTGVVTLVKGDVGLSNVDNVQQAPMTHVGTGGTAHAAATTSTAGFMSAADKTKLDGIASGAQVNTVSSVAGRTGAVTLVKGDVGLGSVENYGLATQAEAEAGNSAVKFMTPQRTAQAIAALAPKTAAAISATGGTTVQAEIDTLKSFVSDGKTLIASAITDKGVPTEATEAFSVMADNIGNISGVVVRTGLTPKSVAWTISGDNHILTVIYNTPIPTIQPTPTILNAMFSISGYLNIATLTLNSTFISYRPTTLFIANGYGYANRMISGSDSIIADVNADIITDGGEFRVLRLRFTFDPTGSASISPVALTTSSFGNATLRSDG